MNLINENDNNMIYGLNILWNICFIENIFYWLLFYGCNFLEYLIKLNLKINKCLQQLNINSQIIY